VRRCGIAHFAARTLRRSRGSLPVLGRRWIVVHAAYSVVFRLGSLLSACHDGEHVRKDADLPRSDCSSDNRATDLAPGVCYLAVGLRLSNAHGRHVVAREACEALPVEVLDLSASGACTAVPTSTGTRIKAGSGRYAPVRERVITFPCALRQEGVALLHFFVGIAVRLFPSNGYTLVLMVRGGGRTACLSAVAAVSIFRSRK